MWLLETLLICMAINPICVGIFIGTSWFVQYLHHNLNIHSLGGYRLLDVNVKRWQDRFVTIDNATHERRVGGKDWFQHDVSHPGLDLEVLVPCAAIFKASPSPNFRISNTLYTILSQLLFCRHGFTFSIQTNSNSFILPFCYILVCYFILLSAVLPDKEHGLYTVSRKERVNIVPILGYHTVLLHPFSGPLFLTQ